MLVLTSIPGRLVQATHHPRAKPFQVARSMPIRPRYDYGTLEPFRRTMG
jgi:hypothetical protein